MNLIEFEQSIAELLERLNNMMRGTMPTLINIVLVIIGVVKLLEVAKKYIKEKMFVKRKICANLSAIESAEVYYALDKYIPTRFSTNEDSGDEDEPSSDYANAERKKESLLIDYLMKYEFNMKNGVKYYLCLADCGMGKTTFLINLYYQLVKKKKLVEFISLQDAECLEKIDKIDKKGQTVLLLDALDENQSACVEYNEFIEILQKKTVEFQRVVITSRTNFFESEEKEHLSEDIRISGTVSKFANVKKFYIEPFTDEDIRLFLRKKYPHKKKKQKEAWELIEDNRNLSVRPLLLRFIDEVLEDGESFEYDFELYECLFRKWINREKSSMSEESAQQLYKECEELAKAIYYQWMKNGKTGIYSDELTKNRLGIRLKKRQLKGHAILNRTKNGMYKFSHKSYWEFLLAKLALTDLSFAMDLNIRNFERAESFFLEMVKAENEKTEINYIGHALYMMKYEYSDDMERVCYISRIMNSNDKLIAVSAAIIKSECLYRQHQYEKAEEVLKEGKKMIKHFSINSETLFIYVEFGKVFSQICKKLRLKDAQMFLEDVIDYCVVHDIRNYNVLKCYDAYCNCCMNSFFRGQKITGMNQLIEESFAGDEYANYLKNRVTLVINKYDVQSYKSLEKIIGYSRYMDLYEQILYLSDYQISAIKTRNISQYIAIENCFDGVWKLHDLIDCNNKRKKMTRRNCFYKIDIYEKIIKAYEVANNKNLKGQMQYYIEALIEYMKRFRTYEQMNLVLIEILGEIGKSSVWSYNERECALKKQLDVVQKYAQRFEVDVYWNFYLLYSEWTEKKGMEQDVLRMAYNLTQKDDTFHMTENYCNLLCAVLDYYEKPIYKNRIAAKLLNNTPKIYGKNVDRINVYYSLQRYYVEHNNKHEIDVNEEILRCKFNCEGIESYYKSCKKIHEEELFYQKMVNICLNEKQLTRIECMELDKFVKNNNKIKMKKAIFFKMEELVQECFNRQSAYIS